MIKKIFISISLCTLLLITFQKVLAQGQNINRKLEAAVNSYNNLKFSQAIEELKSILGYASDRAFILTWYNKLYDIDNYAAQVK